MVRKTPTSEKQKNTDGKFPDYFYENAPSWVEALTKARIKFKPTGTKANAKYCGNCKHLVSGRNEASGEPYCSKNNAAVRAQWVCSKWGKGDVAKIKSPKLGVDV